MHIVGTHDDNTIEQLKDVDERAAQVAIMADGHKGYWMPIGGVAAFRDWVSPAGVGYDIACGNCAIQTDMHVLDLGPAGEKRSKALSKIADDIASHVSFGIGRSNVSKDAPTDHPLFDDERWEVLPAAAPVDELKKLARDQLGTVGGGNHYVDVFYDEDGVIWVGVHFGSRGFGHKICTGFSCIGAGARWSKKVVKSESNPGALMHLNTWGGQAYWAMMEVAGDYAYAGREWVARKVVELIGAHEVDMIHNHHNFAWKEKQWMEDSQQVEDVIVIRKGATPAFPNQRGFVGGSMGDQSVILQGADNALIPGDEEFDTADVRCLSDGSLLPEGQMNDQVASMFSTVHGAGRVMGRMQAKGKKDKKTGEWKREPLVTQEMMDEWVAKVGIELRGGAVDESPHVYRRLPEVLEAQGDTITVLKTLQPLIVCMAPRGMHDPFKD